VYHDHPAVMRWKFAVEPPVKNQVLSRASDPRVGQ
jgi:hypothetical protein